MQPCLVSDNTSKRGCSGNNILWYYSRNKKKGNHNHKLLKTNTNFNTKTPINQDPNQILNLVKMEVKTITRKKSRIIELRLWDDLSKISFASTASCFLVGIDTRKTASAARTSWAFVLGFLWIAFFTERNFNIILGNVSKLLFIIHGYHSKREERKLAVEETR